MHLVQELDGVRLFNSEIHEFLFKVSDESKAVFQIGLQTPASMLYDSLENIKAHSSQAGATIRDLGDDLPYAIDTCIAAASCEPIVELQQALLRTASFGKAFLDVYNGDKLVDMCKHLRIVNCLAQHENGIPVSTMQFLSQPFEDWVARLLNRNQHQLAILLCRYMEEPADQVYIHWACAKIRASTIDDDALYKIIMSKLQSVPGISYVNIAEVANTTGYQKLAIRLLKHEPRAGNQVPLLISMGQESTAMDEAIRSGDADLVYFVIFHLFKSMELVDFFKVISRSRVAGQLFEKYCVEQESPVLRDYYYQEDARRKSAQLILIDNLGKRDVGELVANLKVALDILQKDKTSVRQTKALDSHIKLLKVQYQLEQEMQGESFVGLTVNETLAKCVVRGNYTRANKLKGDFKVPERRFYWIKVHALVQRRDWAELARLANARKPPIGYRAFVDECIGALQYQEAA
ncbi:Vacuolar protein, partial [Linderina macrospora]